MARVGYSLVRLDDGARLVTWTGPTIPHRATLANGDAIEGMMLGVEFSGMKLVEVHQIEEPPSRWHAKTGETESFDGEKFVVTFTYQAEPNIAPENVTMFQCRAALFAAGLLQAVEDGIAAMGGINVLAWEYAPSVSRNSPLVNDVAAALGLTSAQVDDLFRAAADIAV